MIRFTRNDLDVILADFLGKPYQARSRGPNSYDCYGLAKAFMARVGVDLPDVGVVDPKDARPVYEQQQTDYIPLEFPRPWSLVTFSSQSELDAHIGVVLPYDNLFLHCPGRAAGKVIAEPLSRRPWRDAVDGYWWPRNYMPAVVMLTPMTTTKRAWQFVRLDGRTLGQIIEQEITEGRDIPVQAFLGGELVDPKDWSLVPTESDELVIRPELGDGQQIAMMGGMIALSLLAPWAMGALAPNLTAAAVSGAANLSTVIAYKAGVAAITMTGALAMNALVGADEADADASQNYSWTAATTQRVGSYVPLVYGTFGTPGVLICSYATSELTTKTYSFSKNEYIRSGTDLLNLKIALSDGPIEGVVEGTEELNGKSLESYDDDAIEDFVIERFNGTDDQAASSVLDAFEIPVNQLCKGPADDDYEVTADFRAIKCDRAGVVLRFPTFANYTSDNDYERTSVDVRILIREYGTETWHTLADETIYGKSKKQIRILRYFDQTYDGGSSFTIVEGTRYEVQVSRENSRHSDHGDDFYFDSIQLGFDTAQKLPGIAYTAIGAAASEDISGSLEYYGIVKGKLVRVYNATTETWSIEWSDNPAWVTFDVLTRPVIKGNGDSVPYEVEYYKRLDPGYLILDDFVAFADWCDELVDDGEGGTEKRYRFNGIFDTEMTCWEAAIKVCKMACAMPCFEGHQIGVIVDKPTTPSQMFNVSNLREGFSETWINWKEAATVYDVNFYDEDSDYGPETWPVPLRGAKRNIPASMDGFGHTKRSQVWRRAIRQLRVNQYMRRTAEIPACLDAIYTRLGDVAYVQHPALNRATGGRIVEVYSDGVKLDKAVEMGEGDYALLIRTHDGTAERLTLYVAASVTGEDNDIVTIEGVWEYTPNANDIWTFGEEAKVIDLYRIKGFERFGDGKVLIQGTQYTTDYYTDDENPPRIEAQSYSSTKGGLAPSLLPTTAQAVAASTPDTDNVVDTVIWQGLSFEGDGTDTVTWSCDGEGIKYRGNWCPIYADTEGTTDRYIYFDPAIGDPRYLQTTNDLTDLAGYERYLFCINRDGVAYFKGGVLVGSDGVLSEWSDITDDGGKPEDGADVTGDHQADVCLDNATEGTKFLKTFQEYFLDPMGDAVARWAVSGSTNCSVATGGVSGSNIFVVGDNSGDDQAWLVCNQSIPFDPSLLYRVRCRIRQTAGSGICYIGVAGRNAADDAWVNASGLNTLGSQHYIVYCADTPDSDWTVHEGYIKGTDTTGHTWAHPDPSDPAVLHEDVRWIHPMVIANESAAAGIVEIDSFTIEVVSPTTFSSVYTEGSTSVSAEATVQSLAVATNGESVLVQFGAIAYYSSAAGSVTWTLYRVEDATETLLATFGPFAINSTSRISPIVSAYKDSPSKGSYTYTLKGAFSGSSCSVVNRWITTTEAN